MKTGTKVSFIVFIVCATLFSIAASFVAFESYVETKKFYMLILASIDMFCALIDIMNLGINLERWSR